MSVFCLFFFSFIFPLALVYWSKVIRYVHCKSVDNSPLHCTKKKSNFCYHHLWFTNLVRIWLCWNKTIGRNLFFAEKNGKKIAKCLLCLYGLFSPSFPYLRAPFCCALMRHWTCTPSPASRLQLQIFSCACICVCKTYWPENKRYVWCRHIKWARVNWNVMKLFHFFLALFGI